MKNVAVLSQLPGFNAFSRVSKHGTKNALKTAGIADIETSLGGFNNVFNNLSRMRN